MLRRFFELAIRGRRLAATAPESASPSRLRTRPTARRGVGGELTQFSFRLALAVDLVYVGMGALGGAAIGRTSVLEPAPAMCSTEAPGPVIGPARDAERQRQRSTVPGRADDTGAPTMMIR